jgi:hypothetical protein
MKHQESVNSRRMWMSVVLQMMKDLALRGATSANDRRDAEYWVGTFPSASFIEVCGNAGLDPDKSWIWFRALCDLPYLDRRPVVQGMYPTHGRVPATSDKLAA